MGLTLAQRTQLRKRAAMEAAQAEPALTMEGASAYEMQLAQLQQHRLQLKNIQSGEGKAELKRQLLADYVPYIEGVLSAGRGVQDEVVTTIMLWRIDAGDYSGALQIGAYVLEHNLLMPDRFERSSACLLAEETAEAALKAQKAGGSFDLDVLLHADQLTQQHDMPDQARAKLHLAIGKAYLAKVDPQQPAETDADHLEGAQTQLARAIELHSACGGKKDLEQVVRLLKKQPEPTPS